MEIEKENHTNPAQLSPAAQLPHLGLHSPSALAAHTKRAAQPSPRFPHVRPAHAAAYPRLLSAHRKARLPASLSVRSRVTRAH